MSVLVIPCGSVTSTLALDDAVARALARGCAVFAAAGNDDATLFPAASAGVTPVAVIARVIDSSRAVMLRAAREIVTRVALDAAAE